MPPAIAIQPLTALPPDLAALEAESLAQGFRLVRRLREEWQAGTERFDAPGAVLLAAFSGSALVGIGGLTPDPYLADPRIGRLRHLYVLAAHRRAGAGRALVEALLAHARGRFTLVRLSTDRATAFYDALGFTPADAPQATHLMPLT